MREGDGDKRLHIAGTPPVQATVFFHDPEGIGIPVLSVDRHDIGVPRQHDTAPVERSRGRVKIRLAFVVVESQVRTNPETVQIVPDPVNQFQIGFAARRIERDERFYHFDGSGISLHQKSVVNYPRASIRPNSLNEHLFTPSSGPGRRRRS